jgi:pyruvate-flavodoxin oxidoreductase
LNSKEPNFDAYQEFLQGEVRYLSLSLKNPERAKALDQQNEQEARERYEKLKRMVELYNN